jgi:hypothetical protein
MILNAFLADSNQNIVIKTADTDVAIIALVNMSKFDDSKRIWIQTGRSRDNSFRYIDLSNLYLKLNPNLSNALPALHALTGSDYTPSFLRKGKIKSFSILKGNEKYLLELLFLLGKSEIIEKDILEAVESLICKSYFSKSNFTSVNDLRYHLIMNFSKPSKRSKSGS